MVAGRQEAALDVDVVVTQLEPDGIQLVSLQGGPGSRWGGEELGRVDAALAAGTPTIIDVAGVPLDDTARVARLVATLAARHPSAPWCVVAGRLPARRRLLSLGVSRGVWVFTTVADAVQSWRMYVQGYGVGWARADVSALGRPSPRPQEHRVAS